MGVFDYLPAQRIKQRYRPKPETAEEAMRRWPRLTAHLISHSLGYATPTKAALIILDATHRRENWCEWIFECYDRNPVPAVQRAISGRHHHKGFMADYRMAYALVKRALDSGEEPMFGSWF